MAFLKTILCLLLIIVAASPCGAKELTVVSGSYYPPYFQWDRIGKPGSMHGMLPDFLDAFAKEHPKYTFRHVMLTRRRMDMWMSDGRGDMMSLNNPMFVPRAERFLFTKPLWQVSDVVVSRAKEPVDYSRPEDLHGLRVGVRAGNGYGQLDEHLDSGAIHREAIGSVRQMLRMLLLKRLDALILPRYQVLLRAHEHDLDPSLFHFSETPVFTVDLCIQVQKEHADLVRDLNGFIERAHETGLLEGLERLYYDRLN